MAGSTKLSRGKGRRSAHHRVTGKYKTQALRTAENKRQNVRRNLAIAVISQTNKKMGISPSHVGHDTEQPRKGREARRQMGAVKLPPPDPAADVLDSVARQVHRAELLKLFGE